jgi:hypothetical protein
MEQCLFCLEEHTENNIVIKIDFGQYYEAPVCTCKLYTHVGCWSIFILHKGRTECPICHKIYITNTPVNEHQQHYIIIHNRVYQNSSPPEDNRCKNMAFRLPIIIFCIFILCCAIFILVHR